MTVFDGTDGGVILGIESSCDDTAVALVTAKGEVLASRKATQEEIHAEFGGVYPEFASRAHVKSIIPAVEGTFKDAGISPRDLRAIGVTRGPGLIGSLLVGINTAAGLGLVWDKPVIGVNHLRGHLRSADLEEARITYPALIFLVSGGHTVLAHMRSTTDIRIVGTTRDDSVGEAYDKVARMLGLGYPGGPEIDRRAKVGTATMRFPRPLIREGLEFSWSGLKAAVGRHVDQNGPEPVNDLAASFVKAVLDVVEAKCRKALDDYPSSCMAVVGGVAASPQIRESLGTLCAEKGVTLCLPPLKWSTDNAAMIALAAWDYLAHDITPLLVAQARLSIEAF
jgi:N6-L-threonylcarbamoyladenine synthase